MIRAGKVYGLMVL